LKINLSRAEIILDINKNKALARNSKKEIVNLKRYIEIQEAKLNNQGFVNKAPKEVVEQERRKLTEAKNKLIKLTS
jgi:valyl-tRNA synthetase